MKILVPVDGSAHSMKGLEIAADFAKTKQADIYVISVAPGIGGMEDLEIPPARKDRYLETVEKMAHDAVSLACEFLAKEQVVSKCAKLVASGSSVPVAIIDFAENEGIDLIVLGSRGLTASSEVQGRKYRQSGC
jgi:nucleotide-binding universal stress UspA family protein